MKKIIFILFLTFGIKSAFAECSSIGMQFFPETKEIGLHSMFIIQGYALSQETINSFKNRVVYLESEGGELVVLNLQEILKGQMKLTQAIFCPSKELKPNTTYYLKYADQTEQEINQMKQWNPEKKESERVFWKTTEKKSLASLNLNLSLEFENTEVTRYGCGPSVNAIFKIKNKSASETWYKTEVMNLSTNSKTTFYKKERNGRLYIGHGMCSGAFTFDRKGKYKVRFTPMNIDGKSLKTTEWKTFDSPFMNYKS
ncbi:hypothetical protein [uncultured Aquimarina sp.]|uniref:hypothetical protein n=1 Tax=uncultured Aquimarina sp. TaxID=575652 RepID=UPI00263A0C1C|nr:hypothetical protein [uncultured Aquimarina sp.]